MMILLVSDPEINRIGTRVMNELVKTFRETHMDENEFVCLKAIVFFDPSKFMKFLTL